MTEEEFFMQMKNLRGFMMIYRCAIREVKTKFEVLNEDLSVIRRRNPIQFIESRVKSPESILKKMKRKNLPYSIEAIVDNIDDIAGIRVVCGFIDDIYEVAHMLEIQDDITLIQVKDYIKNPKPNGYRSYHMIVEIPVFFANRKQNVRVEVQLRTIAMDFWASLEHQMRYKEHQKVKDAKEISLELKQCADIIAETDKKMQDINNKIAMINT
ncbi:MAG: GTP pyrophosphokinase family protein [Clostridia bacterium]|nr:GTP pyrophosphokinase family protein [Clostridia bacterium]